VKKCPDRLETPLATTVLPARGTATQSPRGGNCVRPVLAEILVLMRFALWSFENEISVLPGDSCHLSYEQTDSFIPYIPYIPNFSTFFLDFLLDV
jgi:hypothetical protein